MSKCNLQLVELKVYSVVPGVVGDSKVNVVTGVGVQKVRICTTHEHISPLTPTEIAHGGLTKDEVVLDCSASEATKFHRVSF